MILQLNRYVSIPALKHYFNVTTPYVLRKIFLVLFPWRHKPWTRQQRPSTAGGGQDQSSYSYYFLPPREDLNSPDMYIPVMAFVSYILLSTLLEGLRGDFHPQVMGSLFSYALVVVLLEIMILKLGTYILSITNESQLLDLVAYSGYKFVGVIVTLIVAEVLNLGKGTGGWAGWTVFTYTFLANALFLVSSCAPLRFYYEVNNSIATVTQIRTFTRLVWPDRRWNDSYHCSISTEPTDAIPLCIRLYCAIRLHVGSQPAE